MRTEFASVQYTLFQFVPSILGTVIYTVWHTERHVTTKTLSHLMPPTCLTMGSHLHHCTPSINCTVSPRGRISLKPARVNHPPKTIHFARPGIVLSSYCTHPYLREAKMLEWTHFLSLDMVPYNTQRCHTTALLCTLLKRTDLVNQRVWGVLIRLSLLVFQIQKRYSLCLFSSRTWTHPILLVTM